MSTEASVMEVLFGTGDMVWRSKQNRFSKAVIEDLWFAARSRVVG